MKIKGTLKTNGLIDVWLVESGYEALLQRIVYWLDQNTNLYNLDCGYYSNNTQKLKWQKLLLLSHIKNDYVRGAVQVQITKEQLTRVCDILVLVNNNFTNKNIMVVVR